MDYLQYQVDAFAHQVFKGNPAAVMVLDSWLPADRMQHIAMENNLSETAFVVENHGRYHIRWFTPAKEIALCGHATLATAKVLISHYQATLPLVFDCLSGELVVREHANGLCLDFPATLGQPIALSQEMHQAMGIPALEAQLSDDLILLYENEAQIRALEPDFNAIKAMPYRAIIATAKGDEVDFVSRFFAPAVGVNEDPVTGSAHTKLVPYWAKKLAKTRFKARQISQRGGELECELKGDRVWLIGDAVIVMKSSWMVNLDDLVAK